MFSNLGTSQFITDLTSNSTQILSDLQRPVTFILGILLAFYIIKMIVVMVRNRDNNVYSGNHAVREGRNERGEYTDYSSGKFFDDDEYDDDEVDDYPFFPDDNE